MKKMTFFISFYANNELDSNNNNDLKIDASNYTNNVLIAIIIIQTRMLMKIMHWIVATLTLQILVLTMK